MKTIILTASIIATILTGCNNDTNQSKEANKNNDTTTNTQASEKQPASVNEVLTAYLELKNALANDNAKEAGSAGKQLIDEVQKLDQVSITDEQKKVYDDVKDEIKEHAEHISTKSDDIAHQRQHFEMLSNDMYDLVKAIKPAQTLYKDHCPMYNDNKGASWLSEVKEIKNPYLGKKMPTCGTVKEEINP